VVGLVSLERLSRNQSELGYWVAPAFWNQGVASEVSAAIIEANPMENDTIFAAVFQDNPASARVLTNCGFGYVGDAEAFSVARNAKVATWTYIRKFT
jgi:RimJ/RimL family protein N-acetyltransferase